MKELSAQQLKQLRKEAITELQRTNGNLDATFAIIAKRCGDLDIAAAIVRHAHKAMCPELSSREREILLLLAAGHDYNMIAHQTCLSARTVKRHIANIMKKLMAYNTRHAVILALRRGVIALDIVDPAQTVS